MASQLLLLYYVQQYTLAGTVGEQDRTYILPHVMSSPLQPLELIAQATYLYVH